MRITSLRRSGRCCSAFAASIICVLATTGLLLVPSPPGVLAASPNPLTCSILPQDGLADVGVPVAFSVLSDGGEGSKSYTWTFSGPASPSTSTKRSLNVVYSTAGTFRVSIRVTDESGECSYSTNVTSQLAQNVPPVANDDSYEATIGLTLFVDAPGVLGNDTSRSSNLTAVLESDAAKGTLVLNPDGSFNYAYTGKGPFPDTDSFTYQAEDEFAQFSDSATVTITITKVGSAGGPSPSR